MAAKRSSTYAKTAKQLRFISHSDLPKLNSCSENCRKILYKSTEIHSSLCSKIKQCLSSVEGILYIDKLHFEAVLFDLLLTNCIGLLLFLMIQFRNVRCGCLSAIYYI